VETRDLGKAVRAIESTVQCIKVDCVYWFSNSAYPSELPGVDVIHVTIPDFVNFFEDVNRIYLRLMPNVVTTDFNLIVQWDGFAVNSQAWDNIFWDYDYIGAAWPWMWGGGPYWRQPIVGNGGFCLRSRKLYHALTDLDLNSCLEEWLLDERSGRREYYGMNANGDRFIPEDLLISLWHRQTLENKYGIKFCPPELANKFSVETLDPFTQYWLGRSFGFHGVAAAPHYGVTL
jgi:hypothetical protein